MHHIPTISILNIPIHSITKEGAEALALSWLSGPKTAHTIFTPNPEMLVAAYRNPIFQKILETSSLNLCDGFGLMLAAKISGISLVRITGSEFFMTLCSLAEKQGKSVFLLGSRSEATIQRAKKALHIQFPNLVIVGTNPGPEMVKTTIDSQKNAALIAQIQEAKPDILFVAFGHEKQEWWIHEFLGELPSVRIAMGVGGVFDVLAGNVPKPPEWMQKLGLEWLWRLLNEPWRIKRILTAVIVFPTLFLWSRIRGNKKPL